MSGKRAKRLRQQVGMGLIYRRLKRLWPRMSQRQKRWYVGGGEGDAGM
jgi:hypothetical protein